MVTYALERQELAINGLVSGDEGCRLLSMEKMVLSGNHGCLSKMLAPLGEAFLVPRNKTAPSDVTKLLH